jgi:hypothetical protein
MSTIRKHRTFLSPRFSGFPGEKAIRLMIDGAVLSSSRLDGSEYRALFVRELVDSERLLSVTVKELIRDFDAVDVPTPELGRMLPRATLRAVHSALGPNVEPNITVHGKRGFALLAFDVEPQLKDWAKVYSYSQFLEALPQAVAQLGSLGFSTARRTHSVEYVIEHGTSELGPCLQQAISQMHTVLAATDALAKSLAHPGSLIMFFNVPEEYRAPSEQYLAYFGQFLSDLGVDSETSITSDARGILFTVTPVSGDDALQKVRDAISAYLRIPSSLEETDEDLPTTVAAQEVLSVAWHFRSQLILRETTIRAQYATIRAQEATINAQAANIRLLDSMIVESETKKRVALSSVSDAPLDLFDGTVSITNVQTKWGMVRLPMLLRKLHRTIRGVPLQDP